MTDPATWLKDRAESYWRDSRRFDEDGDKPMAAAYRTISEELRRCAEDCETLDPPPVPVVADPALIIDVIAAGAKVPRRRR